MVFSGDTTYSRGLVEAAQGADLLIHEALTTDDEHASASYRLHSTSGDAARVAEQASVKQLIITHIGQRLPRKPRPPPRGCRPNLHRSNHRGPRPDANHCLFLLTPTSTSFHSCPEYRLQSYLHSLLGSELPCQRGNLMTEATGASELLELKFQSAEYRTNLQLDWPTGRNGQRDRGGNPC